MGKPVVGLVQSADLAIGPDPNFCPWAEWAQSAHSDLPMDLVGKDPSSPIWLGGAYLGIRGKYHLTTR